MRGYISTVVVIAVVTACYALPAQALQIVCSNSPENPTAILGLLCAAAAGYPYVRGRARVLFSRKSRRDKPAD